MVVSHISYSLKPHRSPLNDRDLLHLIRRCVIGFDDNEFQNLAGKDIDSCLDQLLIHPTHPHPPIQEDSDVEDPLIAKGETWVNASFGGDLINNRRLLFLKMWWMGLLLNRPFSLQDRMVLFLHNHFPVEIDQVIDARIAYRYIDHLYAHALGNYQTFIEEGSLLGAMLLYLNGAQNTAQAPNENYARELLELFTLGKVGQKIFTESDVQAVARILTGFRIEEGGWKVFFDHSNHDSSDKVLSHAFNHQIIKARGKEEWQQLVRIIFNHENTALHICRNLYRWFVTDRWDHQTETEIIAPLAAHFRENNFELKPVLRKLLSSEHFFSPAFRGCLVKSPIDFLVGLMRQFQVIEHHQLSEIHEPWLQCYFTCGDLGMDLGNPHSVAGWPAYHQAPRFGQWWALPSSIQQRFELVRKLCSDEGMVFNGTDLQLHLPNSLNPQTSQTEVLLSQWLNMVMAVPLSSDRQQKLIHQWQAMSANQPNIHGLQRDWIAQVCTQPEYQLM